MAMGLATKASSALSPAQEQGESDDAAVRSVFVAPVIVDDHAEPQVALEAGVLGPSSSVVSEGSG